MLSFFIAFPSRARHMLTSGEKDREKRGKTAREPGDDLINFFLGQVKIKDQRFDLKAEH